MCSGDSPCQVGNRPPHVEEWSAFHLKNDGFVRSSSCFRSSNMMRFKEKCGIRRTLPAFGSDGSCWERALCLSLQFLSARRHGSSSGFGLRGEEGILHKLRSVPGKKALIVPVSDSASVPGPRSSPEKAHQHKEMTPKIGP